MKKRMYLMAVLLTGLTIVKAQNNLGINNPNPPASAALMVDTAATGPQGILIPRMTEARRNAIPTPANGLMIYQTDGTSGFYFYNGTAWMSISGGASGWSLTGNTGTNATNFIGNTDDKDLYFKINSTNAGYISSNNTFYNTSLGYNAGTASNITNYGNAAFGYAALTHSTEGGNTAVGSGAFENGTSPVNGTALGNRAGQNINGASNVAIGRNALQGSSSVTSNTAFNNVAMGTDAALNVTSASNNIIVGTSSGTILTTGSKNTIIGYQANVSANNLSNATAIGNGAIVNTSNKIRLGDNNVTSTEIAGQLRVNGQVIGTNDFTLPANRGTANQVLTTDGAGATSWAAAGGGATGWSLTGNTGTNTATDFIGTTDNVELHFHTNNVFRWGITQNGRLFNNPTLGSGSLFISAGNETTTGVNNTAVGNSSMLNNTTGNKNTSFGNSVLTANTTGVNNTAIGYLSMNSNIDGAANVAVGLNSLQQNTSGSLNTAIGQNSLLSNTTGSSNTGLGFGANVSANNLSNATAIGNGAVVNASNKIRLGDNNVTATDIAGQVKVNAQSTTNDFTLPTTRGTTNQVLTTNGAGATSWAAAGGGSSVSPTQLPNAFIGRGYTIATSSITSFTISPFTTSSATNTVVVTSSFLTPGASTINLTFYSYDDLDLTYELFEVTPNNTSTFATTGSALATTATTSWSSGAATTGNFTYAVTAGKLYTIRVRKTDNSNFTQNTNGSIYTTFSAQ